MKCANCSKRIIGRSKKRAWRIYHVKFCSKCFYNGRVLEILSDAPLLLKHLRKAI